MITLVARALERHRLAAAFLTGLALGLSFPKCGCFWFAWLVPGPLLVLGAGQPGKTVFRVGFYAGLGNCLCSLYWLLLIPMKLHAVAAWFTLSVYLALFYGAWCWVCWRCAPSAPLPPRKAGGPAPAGLSLLVVPWPRRALWAVFCGVGWAAMELTIARFWWGFPWNPLGSSQYQLLPLIQIASVTGVGGVSFVVVWVSVALWGAGLVAWQARPKFSRLAPELAVPLITLAGILAFG